MTNREKELVEDFAFGAAAPSKFIQIADGGSDLGLVALDDSGIVWRFNGTMWYEISSERQTLQDVLDEQQQRQDQRERRDVHTPMGTFSVPVTRKHYT